MKLGDLIFRLQYGQKIRIQDNSCTQELYEGIVADITLTPLFDLLMGRKILTLFTSGNELTIVLRQK